MATVIGLRTVGAVKSIILTPTVVGAIAWSGFCYGDGNTQTEQQEKSEADHVSVMTGLAYKTNKS